MALIPRNRHSADLSHSLRWSTYASWKLVDRLEQGIDSDHDLRCRWPRQDQVGR